MTLIEKILFLMLLFTSANSQAQDISIQNGFITGNTFRAMEKASKNVYVTGLLDGMLLAPLYGAPEKNLQILASCTVNMNGQQLVAIFEKFLTNHPERWNQSMHIIGYSAMHKICIK